MRYCIPIIASNYPVRKKLIEENECGICVNPSDYKEISQVFEYMINNPTKAKKMGENGKRLIREKYNWEEESKKLINIYENLNN